jgi:hypothetical protein
MRELSHTFPSNQEVVIDNSELLDAHLKLERERHHNRQLRKALTAQALIIAILVALIGAYLAGEWLS